MTREVVAQQPPSVPLDGFPIRRITPAQALQRAHTVAYGPWWFGSDGVGRYDLPLPRGTCSLADSAVVAVEMARLAEEYPPGKARPGASSAIGFR